MLATTIMQIRRDIAANWTANNPTLAQGEPGLELNSGQWKIGDGATPWSGLGYQPTLADIPSAPTLTTANIASGSLAVSDTDTSKAIAIGKVGVLLSLSGDPTTDCRFTLYASVAARAGDVGRPFGASWPAGSGVLLDTVLGAGAKLSQMLVYASMETTPTSDLPVSITNIGTTTASIEVTAAYAAIVS